MEYKLTTKEENIQRALGTLPLWRRIELGEAKFIEEVVPIVKPPGRCAHRHITKRRYTDTGINTDVTISYLKREFGDKEQVIDKLIKILKEQGI